MVKKIRKSKGGVKSINIRSIRDIRTITPRLQSLLPPSTEMEDAVIYTMFRDIVNRNSNIQSMTDDEITKLIINHPLFVSYIYNALKEYEDGSRFQKSNIDELFLIISSYSLKINLENIPDVIGVYLNIYKLFNQYRFEKSNLQTIIGNILKYLSGINYRDYKDYKETLLALILYELLSIELDNVRQQGIVRFIHYQTIIVQYKDNLIEFLFDLDIDNLLIIYQKLNKFTELFQHLLFTFKTDEVYDFDVIFAILNSKNTTLDDAIDIIIEGERRKLAIVLSDTNLDLLREVLVKKKSILILRIFLFQNYIRGCLDKSSKITELSKVNRFLNMINKYMTNKKYNNFIQQYNCNAIKQLYKECNNDIDEFLNNLEGILMSL